MTESPSASFSKSGSEGDTCVGAGGAVMVCALVVLVKGSIL